jgi:hypothetical protein
MKFFSQAQSSLMAEVLDQIVPPGDGFPGAGELGVAEHVDAVLSRSPRLVRLFSDGLLAIEQISLGMFSQEFSAVTNPQKVEVLKKVEADHGDFFHHLARHTYAGYYVDPRVVRLLGLEVRPPQPQGYELEPFDPRLLKNVKKRVKLWRDA